MTRKERKELFFELSEKRRKGEITERRFGKEIMKLTSKYKKSNGIVVVEEKKRGRKATEYTDNIRNNYKDKYLELKKRKIPDKEIARMWGIGSNTLDRIKCEWNVVKITA